MYLKFTDSTNWIFLSEPFVVNLKSQQLTKKNPHSQTDICEFQMWTQIELPELSCKILVVYLVGETKWHLA